MGGRDWHTPRAFSFSIWNLCFSLHAILVSCGSTFSTRTPNHTTFFFLFKILQLFFPRERQSLLILTRKIPEKNLWTKVVSKLRGDESYKEMTFLTLLRGEGARGAAGRAGGNGNQGAVLRLEVGPGLRKNLTRAGRERG